MGNDYSVIFIINLLLAKVMFSQACVILFTIGLMTTRSLLILVMVWSVRILLECFLVLMCFHFFPQTRKQHLDSKLILKGKSPYIKPNRRVQIRI